MSLMGYNFSHSFYLLPRQLESIQEELRLLEGNQSLHLDFSSIQQGTLQRLLREIPPTNHLISLLSNSPQQTGILVLSATIAYTLAHKSLNFSAKLEGHAASLRPVEIAFLRQEILQLLPYLEITSAEKWISAECQPSSSSLGHPSKTWLWARFNAQCKDTQGFAWLAFPTTSLQLKPIVDEESLASVLNVNIPLSVTLQAAYPAGEIRNGMLVHLQHELGKPVPIKVGDIPCFEGKIGLYRQQKAICIQDQMVQEEKEK